MRKIGYLVILVLTLISCQREEYIVSTPTHTKEIVTTYGYFIPTNAKIDTAVWIDSTIREIYEDRYMNGVLYYHELVSSDYMGFDTLYVVSIEAYTGADSHREDIINITSTKGLNLEYVKSNDRNVVKIDTQKQYLKLKNNPDPSHTEYYIYKK